jgi:probable phosphoglycerate mutase
LKDRLKNLHFDAVYSSPLQRATRTAEIAGFSSPKLTRVLREVEYGEYEGKTTRQIRQSKPSWKLYEDGSPGGETPNQILARAQEFIQLVAEVNGSVLAFSHGHFLRAVAIAWMGLEIEAAGALYLDVATLSLLRDHDNERLLAVWNAP